MSAVVSDTSPLNYLALLSDLDLLRQIYETLVIRTPMICADAKILGLIGNVRQKLDDLRVHGFRLSDQHYELILKELGEL